MAALHDIYFKLETLKTIVSVIEKKAEKGVSITVSISDETNQWGQNVSAFVSQSKEQREAKQQRYFVANGKVFWTDGKITAAERNEAQPSAQQPAIEPNDDGFIF